MCPSPRDNRDESVANAEVEKIRYLRSSIGTTGLLALHPVQVTSHRDDWHRYLLVGGDSARHR
jgi:hypothetical protein